MAFCLTGVCKYLVTKTPVLLPLAVPNSADWLNICTLYRRYSGLFRLSDTPYTAIRSIAIKENKTTSLS